MFPCPCRPLLDLIVRRKIIPRRSFCCSVMPKYEDPIIRSRNPDKLAHLRLAFRTVMVVGPRDNGVRRPLAETAFPFVGRAQVGMQ